ncbi:unnamed protein product, partial [Rotaria sp. Silwood2]
ALELIACAHDICITLNRTSGFIRKNSVGILVLLIPLILTAGMPNHNFKKQ